MNLPFWMPVAEYAVNSKPPANHSPRPVVFSCR
jgi:hypothetical protein